MPDTRAKRFAGLEVVLLKESGEVGEEVDLVVLLDDRHVVESEAEREGVRVDQECQESDGGDEQPLMPREPRALRRRHE